MLLKHDTTSSQTMGTIKRSQDNSAIVIKETTTPNS